MKFTSEDLMKAMGIKIGDTIKLNGKTHTFATKKDGTLICKNVLKQLIDQEFEIIPKPKRVGDLMCNDFVICRACPFNFLCEWGFSIDPAMTLLENLERIEDFEKDDKEIYDLLKARLNKEVVE